MGDNGDRPSEEQAGYKPDLEPGDNGKRPPEERSETAEPATKAEDAATEDAGEGQAEQQAEQPAEPVGSEV